MDGYDFALVVAVLVALGASCGWYLEWRERITVEADLLQARIALRNLASGSSKVAPLRRRAGDV